MRSEFVATVRSRCSDRWRATASVVVPALIMSAAPSRTRPAARAPIWSLADVCRRSADLHAGVGPRDGLRADRAAVRPDEDAVGVERRRGRGGSCRGRRRTARRGARRSPGPARRRTPRGRPCGPRGGGATEPSVDAGHGSTEAHRCGFVREPARDSARAAARGYARESVIRPVQSDCTGESAAARREPARSRSSCEPQVPLDDAQSSGSTLTETRKSAHTIARKRQNPRMGESWARALTLDASLHSPVSQRSRSRRAHGGGWLELGRGVGRRRHPRVLPVVGARASRRCVPRADGRVRGGRTPASRSSCCRGPYASTKEQVVAGAASGTMSDVVGLDGAWVSDFAKQGAIADLSRLMADAG